MKFFKNITPNTTPLKRHAFFVSLCVLLSFCLLLPMLSGCQADRKDSDRNNSSSKISDSKNSNNKDSGSEEANQAMESGNADVLPSLSEPLSRSGFLFDTVVILTLYDRGSEELLDECFKLCQTYESLFSRTEEDSDISRINQATEFPVSVSPETAELLSLALSYSALSEGAFDLTVAPLTSLWDFTSLEPVKPSDSAIEQALPHVGYQAVQLSGCEVTLTDPNTGIDLGAIAKGYIADKLKEYLLSEGVGSAVIFLGGNVLCVGEKVTPNQGADSADSASSGFRIGIQKPFEDNNKTIAAVEIRDCSVVSTGIYERCFWQEGQFYHHILNPKTGYPYENDLLSVTIISPKSADGDALSTVCFALGLTEGMALIDSLPDTHAIFITEDETLHYSKGFEDAIILIQ